MNTNDQDFLNQIEENIRSKSNEKDDARQEAEQRAREMERVRQAAAKQNLPGLNKTSSSGTPTPRNNKLANDPRYREYFERLNRQKGITTPPPEDSKAPASAPATNKTPASGSQVIGPGSIVRFDDGSVGVYKDAVSGRDYALFYFLQPDGEFAPEGVFLQCYQAKLIGSLPEKYFAELRDNSAWERDMIVFHLNDYEHVKFLNNLAEHEERKPRNTTPTKTASVQNTSQKTEISRPAASTSTPTAVNSKPEPRQEPETPHAAPESPVEEKAGLIRGRKFQIKFSGKQWEAVYWDSDPNGSIVAHSTHGDWSLMRLDLDRFKDSLELGDMVDDDTLAEIAKAR